jgi:DNA-binding NarL/FixJ family response regulator
MVVRNIILKNTQRKMPRNIKVFHLEDYTIVRDGIRFLLSKDEDIDLVGDANRGDQLFEALESLEIDVLLLDIYLDGMGHTRTMDGFEICSRLTEQYPKVKVIGLSVYDDADSVAKIMKAGAAGFVSKKAGYEELIHAIKAVYEGNRYVCMETSKKLKNLNRFLAGLEDSLHSTEAFFSRREKEVLHLLARGYSSREISKELFITEKTVESHRKNLVMKARVKNTNELIAYAAMRGFIKN